MQGPYMYINALELQNHSYFHSLTLKKRLLTCKRTALNKTEPPWRRQSAPEEPESDLHQKWFKAKLSKLHIFCECTWVKPSNKSIITVRHFQDLPYFCFRVKIIFSVSATGTLTIKPSKSLSLIYLLYLIYFYSGCLILQVSAHFSVQQLSADRQTVSVCRLSCEVLWKFLSAERCFSIYLIYTEVCRCWQTWTICSMM